MDLELPGRPVLKVDFSAFSAEDLVSSPSLALQYSA
jgi:hypothetical protein